MGQCLPLGGGTWDMCVLGGSYTMVTLGLAQSQAFSPQYCSLFRPPVGLAAGLMQRW